METLIRIWQIYKILGEAILVYMAGAIPIMAMGGAMLWLIDKL